MQLSVASDKCNPSRPLVTHVPITLAICNGFFAAHWSSGAGCRAPKGSSSAGTCSAGGTRGANTPHYASPALPPAPAITCLLEDMLVSVLMLLVSVTTIAEGKREVWEYWGGSCLCAYTAERRGTSGRHRKVTQSLGRGAKQANPALHTWVPRGDGYCGDRDTIKQVRGNCCVPLNGLFLRYQLVRGKQGGPKDG